jgi:hypothetical protein
MTGRLEIGYRSLLTNGCGAKTVTTPTEASKSKGLPLDVVGWLRG